MTEQAFFNLTHLEQMGKQVEQVEANAVSIAKPIARAMVLELRRFYEEQDASVQERVEIVQRLTFEYTCMHICDLLRAIADTDGREDVSSAMRFAVSEISSLAEQSNIKTQGNA